MPYTPNPDDAAAPLDTAYASSAALEFRTLKAKVNQLFLSSAINSAENAINTTKSLNVDNTGGSTSDILLGLRGAASRTGGTGSLLGGYFTAVLGDTLTLASGAAVRGLLVEAYTGSTDSVSGTPGLNGAAIITIQQRHAGQAAAIGAIIKFQDRPSALDGGAVVAGLGDDKYNLNSSAIFIQSQRRSSATEKCGWSKGIIFDSYALDDDDNTVKHPCAIEFDGLASFDSARRPVPFNFNTASIEAVATTNGGATTPPTTLEGFIRITVAGLGTFGIPVCSLTAIP